MATSLTGDTNPSASSNLSCSSSQSTTTFSTSFEAGDPQPLATTTPSPSPAGGVELTVTVGGGPAFSPTAKTGVGFTGKRALRYEGRHPVDGTATASVRLFEVDLPVQPETTLSYLIFPELSDEPRQPATYIAIDLAFDDGTRLSELGARDHHGAPATPRGQGESKTLSLDQWNAKRVAVGDVAAGKTIRAILLAYDNPAGPASFGGWIDDVRIGPRRRRSTTDRPSDYVLTTRGTNASAAFSRGNTIPATAVPHGFNFWVPVTDAGSLSWLYEYHRANTDDNRPALQALALSHQPSPWMGDRQTFQVMPSDDPGTPNGDRRARALTFSHDNEVARPHYYSVTFDNGIRAEIAPTDHAAILRFTFTGDVSTLLFDNVTADAHLEIDGAAGVITGYTDVRSPLSTGATRMFLYATVDQPVSSYGRPVGVGERTEAAGYVRFDTTDNKTVTMRIATSLLSIEQAKANLTLEIAPTDTFEDVRERAQRLWDDKLGVLEVENATEDQLVTLYSNLYRLFLYPNSAFENVGTVEEPTFVHAVQSSTTTPPSTPTRTGAPVAPGTVFVNNGFWDTYRTCWPAYALLCPTAAGELVRGFLRQYEDGGWVARWSSPGYADLMVGTSSDVAFADAALRGVPGFDPHLAYEAALKNATVRPPNDHVGRKGFDSAVFLGYPSVESTAEAMSWAMDNHINDFGIAMLARALAERATEPLRSRYLDESVYFLHRSLNYVHLFDPAVGFFQGRYADGRRRLPPEEFDPRIWGFDYTETNAWNMAFHVPHDGAGLAWLYGGPERLEAKLDEFFATPETGDAAVKGSYRTVIHEMVEARDVRMGMYGHSNQPAHHIAYMYAYTPAPWKTQEKVREVLARLYLGSEIGQGYPGDEDNGEMSAWWIFSALGLYPLQVGRPIYVIGSPLFTKAVVHLENGNDLVISAPNNSPENVYVQSVRLNGKPYERTWIEHDVVAAGAVLEFTMGPRPSRWGTGPDSAPPSITTDGGPPRPLVDVTGPGIGQATASDEVDVAALFDNSSSTATRLNPAGFVEYRLPEPRCVEFYTLTSGEPDKDPSAWVLKGSLDGERWEVIDERHGERFPWRCQVRPFRVRRPGAYLRYRFEWADEEPVWLAEIELLTRQE